MLVEDEVWKVGVGSGGGSRSSLFFYSDRDEAIKSLCLHA
jgi:hypothetical protein